jgi:hypothetical protein
MVYKAVDATAKAAPFDSARLPELLLKPTTSWTLQKLSMIAVLLRNLSFCSGLPMRLSHCATQHAGPQ